VINRRFQPIHYRQDDVIFFHLMPGVWNTPLCDTLKRHIAPTHIADLDPEQSNHEILRLIIGNSGIEQAYKAAFGPLLVTVLCDPIQRTLASYMEAQQTESIPQTVALEEYLTDPRFEDRVSNVQTRLLAGKLSPRVMPETTLFLAQTRLEQCAVFGLAERMAESILVLSYVFGWPVEMPGSLEPPQLPISISSQIHDLIIERNGLDLALYRDAYTHFDQGVTRLVDDLLEVSYTHHDAGLTSSSTPAWWPKNEPHLALRTILTLRNLRLRLAPLGSRGEKWYMRLRDKVMH
jgi:hypothetical protein